MALLADVHLRDTRANQPAANTLAEGTLYYVTDESVLEYSTGAAWVAYSATGGVTPHASDHENGGGDEIDVTGLSGQLADAQLPDLDSISTTQGTVLYRNATDWVALAPGTAGQKLRTGGAAANPSWVSDTRTVSWTVDGQGSPISTGALEAYVRVPIACTIVKATTFGDDDIVFDVWRDTYANHPPTVADTITAAAKPTLSGVTKNEDATLTGWSVACPAGSVLELNVDSATATKAQLILDITIP